MNYIETMRQQIGSDLLMTIGCGIILERSGKILLQHRKDRDVWGIPGGVMEPGETFMETAIRETVEETGWTPENVELFGMYSGSEGYASYENGDQVYSVQLIFISREWSGQLIQEGEESHEHRFFRADELPELNPHQARFIEDWANNTSLPVIK